MYTLKKGHHRARTTTTMGNQNADLQTFGGGTPAFVVVLFFCLFSFISPAVCLPFGHAHENILPDWILHSLSWFTTTGRTKPLNPAHPPTHHHLRLCCCIVSLYTECYSRCGTIGMWWVGSVKRSDFRLFAWVFLCIQSAPTSTSGWCTYCHRLESPVVVVDLWSTMTNNSYNNS